MEISSTCGVSSWRPLQTREGIFLFIPIVDMINAFMQWISTIHLDFIFEQKIPDKCSERANELKMKVIPSSLK